MQIGIYTVQRHRAEEEAGEEEPEWIKGYAAQLSLNASHLFKPHEELFWNVSNNPVKYMRADELL